MRKPGEVFTHEGLKKDACAHRDVCDWDWTRPVGAVASIAPNLFPSRWGKGTSTQVCVCVYDAVIFDASVLYKYCDVEIIPIAV